MILSQGNMKIGNMMNISLTPVKSCGGAAQFCGRECYAKKAYRMYPKTRAAWDSNLEHANRDIEGFFNELYEKLRDERPSFFRWHVGGDILNEGYFWRMCGVANFLPCTKFLAFTKQYQIINDWLAAGKKIPENLTIIFSAWPGLPMENPYHLPVAWMQDGTETRVTGEEIECPGSCENCGMCWDIRKIGRDVVFHKH